MTPTLYRIRDWSKHYENKDSRKLRRLSWLPIPIKLNGTGYRLLMRREDGPAIFACFLAMAEAAGEIPNIPGESPDRDGSLKRSNGEPHTPGTLSAKISMPESLINLTLATLSSGEFDWIEQGPFKDSPDEPGESPDEPGEKPPGKARQGKAGHSIARHSKAGVDGLREPERSGPPSTGPPQDPFADVFAALQCAATKTSTLEIAKKLTREAARKAVHPFLLSRWIDRKGHDRLAAGNPIQHAKLFLEDWPKELPVWLETQKFLLVGGRWGVLERVSCSRCNGELVLFEDGVLVPCKCESTGKARGMRKAAS